MAGDGCAGAGDGGVRLMRRTQELEKSSADRTADRIGVVKKVGALIVRMHRRVKNTPARKDRRRVIVGVEVAGQLQEQGGFLGLGLVNLGVLELEGEEKKSWV